MKQPQCHYQIVHFKASSDGNDEDLYEAGSKNWHIYEHSGLFVRYDDSSRDLFEEVIKLEQANSILKFNGSIIKDPDDDFYVLILEETITIGPFVATNELNKVLNAYGLRFAIYEDDFRLVADMEVLDQECLHSSRLRLNKLARYVGSINAEALDLISRFWTSVLEPLTNDVNRQLDSTLVLDLPPEFIDPSAC